MSLFEDPAIFRAILESLQTGVYLVDREHTILFWNDGAERITGHLRQDVVGRSTRDEILAKNESGNSFVSDANEAILSVLRDGKPAVANVSMRHKEGHRVLVRLRAVPIRNSHGTVIGAAESFEESLAVSNWDRRQTRLASYGCLDTATGALTLGYLQAHIRENIADFVEYGVPCSAISIQVDEVANLKAKFGPGAVKGILQAVAQTLGNSLRPTDLLGRGKGTHFIVLLPECPGTEVDKVATRLKKTVTYAEIDWWGQDLSVTASCGVTTALAEDTPDTLVERVENALLASVARDANATEPVES